ncbi:hypothetical protein QWY85_03400 [Neolewinella lacunae]|uniref:Uncharacterized protein n=1 Tax=Neolewinella lacunae TaxID=1517758 RepID=A0A923T6W8_9BACT|nr:hypothetical protein [Neolewinella lacunae]MBC6992949.1 hypothetical protein [Neolewinella lacunae]MDN3633687.1 hypothetical protein [Neolewinella lacunae]
MITPSIPRLIEVMLSKEYQVYDKLNLDYNLNIVGIRNRNIVPESFDDTLVVFHRFQGYWRAFYYPVTTDPSVTYLISPLHPSGTAILKEGQYVSAYTIRPHKGKYLALCQDYDHPTGVKVYRNNTGSGTLLLDENTVESGSRIGINIHKISKNGSEDDSTRDYSQGCTIFANERHFQEFMLLCTLAAETIAKRFTYTLLNEADFTDKV